MSQEQSPKNEASQQQMDLVKQFINNDLFQKAAQIYQTSTLPVIMENYQNIHNLIEKMHQNMQIVFKKKEDELLKTYKQEMIKTQRALKELSESSSEHELRKRMIEKKEELEKERSQFLSQSIDFSNKCKELKETLKEVIATTKDLEGEINFLDEQLIYAEKHNQTLKEELQNLREEQNKQPIIMPINKSKQEISISSKYDPKVSSFIQRKILRDYSAPKQSSIKPSKQIQHLTDEQLQQELKNQLEINRKLNEILKNPCFEETIFERNFNDAVTSVTKQKELQEQKQFEYQRKKPKFLPHLSQEDNQNQNLSRADSSKISLPTTAIDYTLLSGDSFNDYYKRKIFEEFLEKEEIKKIIYDLLFTGQN